MRKIDKGEPVQDFIDFKNNNPDADWDKDAKGHKYIWRKHILEVEQHNQSGYTEEHLSFEKKGKKPTTHIDHFYQKRKDWWPQRTFDWNNYVVDAINDDYGARYKDQHISSMLENQKLINPVLEDAKRYFRYEPTGEIEPAKDLSDEDRDKAVFTRDIFNLNHNSLVERRRKIFEIDFSDYEMLSDDDIIESLVYNGFRSAIEQHLREWKEEHDDEK